MKKRVIYIFIAIFATIFVFKQFSTFISNTNDKQESYTYTEDEIKNHLLSVYESVYTNFMLLQWDNFKETTTGFTGDIKFTYFKGDTLMYAEQSLIITDEGDIKEVTYSQIIPYKDIKK